METVDRAPADGVDWQAIVAAVCEKRWPGIWNASSGDQKAAFAEEAREVVDGYLATAPRAALVAAIVDAARALVTPTMPEFWPRERCVAELERDLADDEPSTAGVRRDELLALMRAVWALDDLAAAASPAPAPAGDWSPAIASRVVVRQGPLSGRHGTVVRLERDGWAVVAVDPLPAERYTMPAANLRRKGADADR